MTCLYDGTHNRFVFETEADAVRFYNSLPTAIRHRTLIWDNRAGVRCIVIVEKPSAQEKEA